MKKSISILLILSLLTLALVGCSSNNTSKENTSNANKTAVNTEADIKEISETKNAVVNITGLNGPTSIGMIKLFEDKPSLGENIESNYSTAATPDLLVSKLLNKEVDIAALPTNVAAKIYNKTEGAYKLAAVNTFGVLYVVSNGVEINSLNDLKGKKVNVIGKGSTPDFAFNYILNKNNIDPEKDLELEYTLEQSELAQAIIGGTVNIAVLPEPFVTMVGMKNSDVKIALNLQDEWKKIEGDNSTIAMGCIVVKDEFAKKYPEAVDTFLMEYEKSINWVNENTEEAGKLVEKFEILPAAKMAEKAIPNCNINFVNATDSEKIVNGFLKILSDFDPKAVGGKLPDEGFYYKK